MGETAINDDALVVPGRQSPTFAKTATAVFEIIGHFPQVSFVYRMK
jgi:hypothetical protein